jgi:nucleotide-binding universal stress UspA family protein
MVLLNARPVVVGYDGTPTSRAALMVAAGEAVRRGRDLLIVHAENDGWDLVRNGNAGRDPLAEAVDLVRPLISRSRVSLLDRIGPAASVLCEQAENAEVLVVGRGNLGLLALIAGSVAIDVACHAPCPVIIVEDPAASLPHEGPVVVGVEREHAEEVLAAAFREAELRRSELIVVHSWNTLHWLGPDGVATVDADDAILREHHVQWLSEVVAPFQSKYPAVAVTEAPREGKAADVLNRSSAGASLIVVGTRGRGPVTGLMLGSVGQKLLRHAQCPVMVVRSHD